VAIKVVEEAPLDPIDQELEPEPDAEPPLRLAEPRDDPEDIAGADSFADAPLLEDGSYADEAAPGTTRLYRVSLDWGQTLSTRVDLPAMTPELEEATSGFGPDLQVAVLDPMRATLDGHSEADPSASYGAEAADMTEAVGPVRFLDRFGSDQTYLPGDHWIAVSVEDDDGSEVRTVPWTLSVAVQGQPTGAPDHGTADGFDAPFLVGEDARSEVASGNPAPAGEADAGSRRLVALGLGVVGLVCCGLGVVSLRRR
jgi:Ca-activated chloride channel family protein